MKNPNEPMTKPQRHIIIDKRCKVYNPAELKEFISKKYGVPFEEVDLRKLTKEQAQDIIVSFKPHPKNLENN